MFKKKVNFQKYKCSDNPESNYFVCNHKNYEGLVVEIYSLGIIDNDLQFGYEVYKNPKGLKLDDKFADILQEHIQKIIKDMIEKVDD